MRRLLIDDELRKTAKQFRDKLEKQNKLHKNPKTRLNELVSTLRDENQKRYVQLILNKWDNLIVSEPNTFNTIISEFETIIPTVQIEIIKIGNRKLYDIIVEAMEYKYVQESIYPDFMKQLGIKTCIYCNAQFAFMSKYNHYTFSNYQLDHWKPKSKYPYLCTTFFNLQPCCAYCNQMKLNKDSVFNLYTDQTRNLFPMNFGVLYASIAKYLCTHKSDDLKIIYKCETTELKENQEELFHITTQYQAHKDVAEEMIWKKEIYNSTFLKIYQETFKNLGFSAGLFNRFIIGNYDKLEDIHKRPLSLLTQSIAKQLKLI